MPAVLNYYGGNPWWELALHVETPSDDFLYDYRCACGETHQVVVYVDTTNDAPGWELGVEQVYCVQIDYTALLTQAWIERCLRG